MSEAVDLSVVVVCDRVPGLLHGTLSSAFRAAALASIEIEVLAALDGRDQAAVEVGLALLSPKQVVISGAESPRDAGLKRVRGRTSLIVEAGTLLGRNYLDVVHQEVSAQGGVVFPGRILVHGSDHLMLDQEGLGTPSSELHRLIFERALFGPIAAPDTVFAATPFGPPTGCHRFGYDAWGWLRRVAAGGCAITAAPDLACSLTAGIGPDPLANETILAARPTTPFWIT